MRICILNFVLCYLKSKLRLSFRDIASDTGILKSTLFNWSVGVMPLNLSDLYKLANYLNSKVKNSPYFDKSERDSGVSFHYLLFGTNQWEKQDDSVIEFFKDKSRQHNANS